MVLALTPRPDNILCCCNRPSAAGRGMAVVVGLCAGLVVQRRRPWRWSGGGVCRPRAAAFTVLQDALWCGLSGLPGLAGTSCSGGRGLRVPTGTGKPGAPAGAHGGPGHGDESDQPKGGVMFSWPFCHRFATLRVEVLRCS